MDMLKKSDLISTALKEITTLPIHYVGSTWHKHLI